MSSELEERYRQSFLSADINQAKLGVLLLMIPLVLYLFNDFQFFGLSLEFYGLAALRLGFLAFTGWLLAYFGRLKSFRSYDKSVFTWGLAGVIVTTLINASRPQNFLFHVIIVIASIVITYLVIPQKFINRAVLSLAASMGELLILLLITQSLALPELFSVTLSLVLANIIGFSSSRLMESYRVRAFKAQEEIADLASKHNKILNGIGDLLFVMDVNRRLVMVNKSTCDAFKKKPEELLGKYCYEIMHGTDRPWSNCPATEMFETKNTASAEVIDPNLGIPLLVTTSPILNEKGELTQCVHVAKDITLRKKVEEKLKESEEKYQTTFESSMDALMLLDERRFLDCNKSTLLLFGCKTVEEFTKYHPADLSPPKQPDGLPSMEAAMNHINRAFKTGTDSFFWIHKRTDGTTFPADVLLTRMPLKDRNVLQATVRDITERKEAEEKLKENSDRIEMMNEKLHVMSNLTRHDVRNKLSAVTGYAYLLKKKHADQADVVDGLGKMEQAVKDVVAIFDFAKMYEQLGVEELTYVDVEKAVDEAVALFSGLTIKVVNDSHGLTVLADSLLRQLFYNFMDNTRKYGEKTTAIRVYYEKAESGELRLIYEDDGVGISAENKLKLFTEGFSTGGSTGFGLFLIKKMIDVYGWTIQETGEAGKGAKFVITIPKVNQSGRENWQIAQDDS